MFGMTKRQFLKRSKKCLKETGTLLLLIREIMNKEVHGEIKNEDALKQMNNIRKSVESLFSDFERRYPPSRCFSLKQRILNALINLQESVVINYEYILAAKEGNEEESKEKLKESMNILEEFRENYHVLVKEVDSLLKKKQKRQATFFP